MKVLVVGGTGYLGAEVADAFERMGAEVLVISRSGESMVGTAVKGDVRRPSLGLDAAELDRVRSGLTHVISCFGSVAWSSGPRSAQELHMRGTQNVIALCEGIEGFERFVHVSSVLALGRADGVVDNSVLDVGQSHRNWYEYGKFLAEIEVNNCTTVPWRVVRLGPVAGGSEFGIPDISSGMFAPVPYLLRGYPIHIDQRGDFPCYTSEVRSAAEIVRRAAESGEGGDVWTWFDPAMLTAAQTLNAVCAAWGVVPRIVDARPLRIAARLVSSRFGAPPDLAEYSERWPEIDPAVLLAIPGELPEFANDYLQRTGELLRANSVLIRS